MVEYEETQIVAKVQPNASHNQVLGFQDGVLYIRIAAPPARGKANQELIKFLSDILGVSKNSLSIEKGMTTKKKRIVIKGLGQNQVMKQFGKHIK